jgi:hypothetical protein
VVGDDSTSRAWEPGPKEGNVVNVAIVLIILALILGGVGLFVEALRWVLIIALILFVWGAISGRGART